MTFEAQLVPGRDRYRVRTDDENERAFVRGARHSRMVRLLRKSLPFVAVLTSAAYFISSGLSITVGGVTASVSGVEVKDGNLRMVNPTLKGVDKKKGNYVISADYADQNMKNPKLIFLHAIKANLSGDEKSWSKLQAQRGLFDSTSERLLMRDDIRVATSSGITGRLTSASLEMDNQIVRSHQPVAFDLPNGTVRAAAMTLRSADHVLMFRGNVKVHINKVEQPDKDQAANQKPPPQINAPVQPARVAPEPASASAETAQ